MFSALGSTLEGARLDDALGGDLADTLASYPTEEVLEWGAGVLTLEDLFGPRLDGVDGLCADPHVLYEFEEDGTSWEVDLRLFGFLQLLGPVQTLFMSLSDTCAEGVRAAGDADAALDAGLCTESESRAFLAEGSACRSCLEQGNLPDDCVASEACASELPLLEKVGSTWLEWAEAEVLGCAPDVPVWLQLGAWDLPDDGTVPASWDHYSWAKLCFLLQDSSSGMVERQCVAEGDGTTELGDGIGDGVITRITYLREAGTDALTHAERVGYNRAIGFESGLATSQFILSYGGIGQISTPILMEDANGDGVVDDADWGYGYGGWGMNPRMLRPDGTDPTVLDDTYARDWLATVAIKMSTTRDGVPINVINHSRCLEWTGPAADGSYTCVKNGGPGLGWFEDNHVMWANNAHSAMYPMPLMTLGSTGLPDDAVPGGLTPFMAGTAALAKPTWDNCTWPHTFVPDHIRTEDQYLDWGGRASLDAQTYRFGKDPSMDLRVVLDTTQARGFCPPWE